MSKARPKRTSESSFDWLATAIGEATRSAKFVVSGTLPNVDPQLAVEGVGRVSLPLQRGITKPLIAACHVAPYGNGTETLVDTRVRKTFELDPQQFQLGDSWNAAIAGATRTIAESLSLPVEQLEARLYKLLVYEKGGFFLPHRDSEKHDRMVASLIVVLPNSFDGGRLIVRHGPVKHRFDFEEARAGKSGCFVAFYADCEHEVERVSSGVRVALAYNLVLRSGKPTGITKSAPADRLADEIGLWVAKQPTEPLVFALEHHYTQRGLSLELLKGADRQMADLIVPAAENAGCLVHMAQVSRHLQQFADDGSFEDSYYRRSYRAPRRHELEIGETYEDELEGTEWVDLAGKKQPWERIAFDMSSIVSSEPLDDWTPTSEEYEGYTGNAGNTLDRWYHRSAIVVWHRDRHFEVVASAGAANCIPLFSSMVKKLAKTPKKHLEGARTDCIRFARGIVTQWPQRSVGYWHSQRDEKSPLDEFPKLLLQLHDENALAAFLKKLAEQDATLPLKSFVVAACREFGWTAFAQELKQLLAQKPQDRWATELPLRDVEWLAAYCDEASADADSPNIASELCEIAVKRFCVSRSEETAFSARYREGASVAEQSLPWLLQALASSGREEVLSQVVGYVREWPNAFSFDFGQVPVLKTLVPWSRKRFGRVLPPFQTWLTAVRQQLEVATAKEPTPPTDWARPADVACTCQYCTQLKTFLADATKEVGRIPAREDLRRHVEDKIRQHQCDVKTGLEKLRSPYSLVLTKTLGSHERAVKRFKADLGLLSALPAIS